METKHSLPAAIGTIVFLAACSSSGGGSSPSPQLLPRSGSIDTQSVGTQSALQGDVVSGGDLFTISNATTGNQILRYHRAADGHLTFVSSFATTGKGSGNGLNGASGTIKYGDFGSFLFAVDAGSNDIVSVGVGAAGLKLLDKVPSGGMTPVSLAVNNNRLYVLNAGSNQINGFTVGSNGSLTPIPGSTATLSGSASDDPVALHLGPGGLTLVAAEKLSNTIDVFTIDAMGRPHGPNTNVSEALTPFGFGVTANGHVIVSDAGGGAAGKAGVSSYGISSNGTLTEITEFAPDHQTAACWIAITHDGKFAYTTNTGSGNVSGYAVAPSGQLTLINASGLAGNDGTPSAPIDIGVSADDGFAYVLDSGTHHIDAFSRNPNATLNKIQTITGLPASAIGLAVR